MPEASVKLDMVIVTAGPLKRGNTITIAVALRYWNSLNNAWFDVFSHEEIKIVIQKSYNRQTWKIIDTITIPPGRAARGETHYTISQEDEGKTVYFRADYFGCNTLDAEGMVEDGYHLPEAYNEDEIYVPAGISPFTLAVIVACAIAACVAVYCLLR